MAVLFGALAALPLRADEKAPSAELLEFLGEWTDENGKAMDPFKLPKVGTKKTVVKEKSGEDDEQDAR